MRDIQDALSDRMVERVVVMASAQVGKTEFVLNTIGYFTDQAPSPMLIVLPTLKLAEAFSKDRLTPMIRDSKALSRKIRDVKTRDSGNTILHKNFDGGHITLAGANSPASLASRPVPIVLCDEVDRFPYSSGKEGDPVELAQKRATGFPSRKKFIEVSTPTDIDSKIYRSYMESDQREYEIPCPHCNEFQSMKFSDIKWDTSPQGEVCNVRFQCRFCEKSFDDTNKHALMLKGKWVAKKPFRGTAGFWINELYSPFVRWKKIVESFLKASAGGPLSLKVWLNTSQAEVWKEKGDAPEWKKLYDRRSQNSRGLVPNRVLFLTAGVDIQKNRIEVQVIGWGKGKERWSVDYRVLEGDTSTPEPWTKLDEMLNEEFQHENGIMLPIRMMAVDSGFLTQTVYDWVRRYPMSRVIAVKGRDNQPTIIGQPSTVDINHRGRKLSRGFKYWPVGTNTAKEELYGCLKIDKPLDGEAYPPGFVHFPSDYDDHYFKGLCSEQIEVKRVRGRPRPMWVKIYDRNEPLDTFVYARAAASVLGIDRFKDHEWERFMRDVPVIKTAPEPKKEDAKTKQKPVQRRKSSFWQ